MESKKTEMRIIFLGLILGCTTLSSAFGQERGDILGEWYTEGKEAKIRFYESDDYFHGKLIWLKDQEDNRPKLDQNNQDESLRNRTLLGINLIRKLEFQDGIWEDGEIYDPESGKNYSCLVKMKDEETLEIRGYLGMPAFGKSVIWKIAK